jgi:cobalt-zinc-cadmium efflux system protein
VDQHQTHQRNRDHDRRALALTLAITATYCLVEVAGGILTNSLALLSDAGHMFADVAALGISLFAARLSRRQPTASKTFGYHRIEILAAFVNGLALWLVVGLIFHEAYQRFHQPPMVRSEGMIAIAAVGLAVNVVSLQILRPRASTYAPRSCTCWVTPWAPSVRWAPAC